MQGLLETAAPRGDFDAALLALSVWLRLSAARWLTWNRNYNIKPREISAAQVRTFWRSIMCITLQPWITPGP